MPSNRQFRADEGLRRCRGTMAFPFAGGSRNRLGVGHGTTRPHPCPLSRALGSPTRANVKPLTPQITALSGESALVSALQEVSHHFRDRRPLRPGQRHVSEKRVTLKHVYYGTYPVISAHAEVV